MTLELLLGEPNIRPSRHSKLERMRRKSRKTPAYLDLACSESVGCGAGIQRSAQP